MTHELLICPSPQPCDDKFLGTSRKGIAGTSHLIKEFDRVAGREVVNSGP